jgi:hypothetical protein
MYNTNLLFCSSAAVVFCNIAYYFSSVFRETHQNYSAISTKLGIVSSDVLCLICKNCVTEKV